MDLDQARMGAVCLGQAQAERRCWNRHSPKAQYFSSLKVKLAVKEIIDLINGSFTHFASVYFSCICSHSCCYFSTFRTTVNPAWVSARVFVTTNRATSCLRRQRVCFGKLKTLWTNNEIISVTLVSGSRANRFVSTMFTSN